MIRIIIGGLIAVIAFFIIFFLIGWLYYSIKSLKDPDVITASYLRMPIYRYRKYKKWYNHHQELMRKYGIGSNEEEEYFLSFVKEVMKHPNEWKRYTNYRLWNEL